MYSKTFCTLTAMTLYKKALERTEHCVYNELYKSYVRIFRLVFLCFGLTVKGLFSSVLDNKTKGACQHVIFVIIMEVTDCASLQVIVPEP